MRRIPIRPADSLARLAWVFRPQAPHPNPLPVNGEREPQPIDSCIRARVLWFLGLQRHENRLAKVVEIAEHLVIAHA